MSLGTQSQDVLVRARTALATCRETHAPDDRTCCFDVDVDVDEDSQRLVLRGVVGTERLLRLAQASIESATGHSTSTTDVDVLEGRNQARTIASTAISVRRRPSCDAEKVTEALYGDKIQSYDSCDEWTRVRVPDGYLGWVKTAELIDPNPIQVDAVITRQPTGETCHDLIPGVECDILEKRAEGFLVEFRTGDRKVVSETVIYRTTDDLSRENITACARSFLKTSYEWGGKTPDGIDCSGLVWITFRTAGLRLPRDSDQQRHLGSAVDRDDLMPADLLFFPGHIAVSLGGSEFIHAYGPADGVMINSFDPDAAEYVRNLDQNLDTARRVIEV